MAKNCAVCGKSSVVERHRNKLRGKYNPTPKFRKYPNLQKTRAADGKRITACAKCIKAKAKTR
ncbi:MAG: 50S ribosomal protein L28 [Patescibacteria group bacterium]